MSRIICIFTVKAFSIDQKDIFFKKVNDAKEISRIGIEIIRVNNEIITYPKGNKLFDAHLVNNPMEWLADYPIVKIKYELALSQLGHH